MSEKFLLIKRGLYWRPDAQGYTGVKSEAGRYSCEEAVARCQRGCGAVTMISEAVAPKYSVACSFEAKFLAEEAENKILNNQVAALMEFVKRHSREHLTNQMGEDYKRRNLAPRWDGSIIRARDLRSSELFKVAP